MKTLKESILSSTNTGKRSFYTLFPKNKSELIKMIKDEIRKNGNECSLNHINVSKITDFSNLFSTKLFTIGFASFNGDISKWDISNAINMESMFKYSMFNGDISGWNVSNVKNMSEMFVSSQFNKDISKWKLNPKCIITDMFLGCSIKNEYKPNLVK